MSAVRGRPSHPNSDNTAAAREASSLYRRHSGSHLNQTVTMREIQCVRVWLMTQFGFTVALLIERLGERNRVALRLTQPSCTYEAEVARLNNLRKREPGAPLERVLALFCEVQ